MKKIVNLISAVLLCCSLSSVYVQAEFIPFEDNWSIINAEKYMGSNYYLSQQDKTELFHKLRNTEKYDVRLLSDNFTAFHGSCYGLAVTSVFASYDMIDYAAYQSPESTVTADCLADIDADLFHNAGYQPSAAAKSLINFYQFAQYMTEIRQYSAHQVYENSEAERVQLLLNMLEDGSPVQINYSFYRDDTQTSRYQHANVAYGVEENGNLGYNWGEQHFDKKILVYEVNVPLEVDDSATSMITAIFVNSKDWSWYQPYWNIGSATGARLDLLMEDVNLMNCCGYLEGTEPYVAEDDFLGIFTTNHLASAHTFENSTTNECSERYMETPLFYLDAVDDEEVNFITPNIEDGYIFRIEQAQKLNTSMHYPNSIHRAYAENASQISVNPSGYTGIDGNSGTYELEMVFNEGYYSGNWYDISVSGSAETASLQKSDEGYLLTADNLDNVKVRVRNDQDIAVLAFSSDEDSVLLDLTECLTIGDLDGNQIVNASDATLILSASANIGSGMESGITATQEAAADVNSDGTFNAEDAALILQYSAAFGSGSFTGTLTEFIES